MTTSICPFHLPAVNELVIYEMHLGTFHDKEDGKSDKLAEAVQKLDHLQRLGVNVIEVMPLAQFAGNLSWAYHPSCVFAVETNYGGPVGFKRFVKAMHQAGFGVILDVVCNHFGPSDLDLWQFEGWSENGQGGIYFYNDWRAETPWGSTRPDYGPKEVRQHYPGRITIAEDLQNDDRITKSADQGGMGFTAQWGARFVHPVRAAWCIPCGPPGASRAGRCHHARRRPTIDGQRPRRHRRAL